MKSTMTFKGITLIALLGAALAAPVLAQAGAGMGGMGGGPCMQGGAGMGAGMGGGMGAGGRGMRSDQNITPGWSLMSPEERTAMQVKMRAVTTYDECKLLQTEQHSVMEARAKEKGITLPAPRQNRCDRMKARGLIS